ncbi:hypothetical protein QMT40_000584 [Parvibaculaceae bacterium PLY_AMNH_Bact1]|nr:hypothetical protein QMT40_000584 [Parvibaculaceae bacterium PLY_AMNH_Bact1]
MQTDIEKKAANLAAWPLAAAALVITIPLFEIDVCIFSAWSFDQKLNFAVAFGTCSAAAMALFGVYAAWKAQKREWANQTEKAETEKARMQNAQIAAGYVQMQRAATLLLAITREFDGALNRLIAAEADGGEAFDHAQEVCRRMSEDPNYARNLSRFALARDDMEKLVQITSLRIRNAAFKFGTSVDAALYRLGGIQRTGIINGRWTEESIQVLALNTLEIGIYAERYRMHENIGFQQWSGIVDAIELWRGSPWQGGRPLSTAEVDTLWIDAERALIEGGGSTPTQTE